MEVRTGGEAGFCSGLEGGEARGQKRPLERREARAHLWGVVQKNENEEETSDIQKREGSGGAKSKSYPAVEAPAIEQRGIGSHDLRRAIRMDRTGPRCNE
jgi:hypothetical protein